VRVLEQPRPLGLGAGQDAVALAARRIELEVDDGDDSVTTLRERRGQTISQLLRSVGRLLVISIALLLTFNVFIDIGPILAGAGILGLAVSFGAQSLVKDFLSGFFILFENQFAIGDVIEAGGKSGTVEKMTLRVVILRDIKGTIHIVPNSEIKVVSNMTRGWSRAVVDVGVPYEESVDRALEILPEHERPVIELAYWSGFSQSEIADRLGIPLGTVKTRTRSALARLADALDEELR